MKDDTYFENEKWKIRDTPIIQELKIPKFKTPLKETQTFNPTNLQTIILQPWRGGMRVSD